MQQLHSAFSTQSSRTATPRCRRTALRASVLLVNRLFCRNATVAFSVFFEKQQNRAATLVDLLVNRHFRRNATVAFSVFFEKQQNGAASLSDLLVNRHFCRNATVAFSVFLEKQQNSAASLRRRLFQKSKMDKRHPIRPAIRSNYLLQSKTTFPDLPLFIAANPFSNSV